MMTTEPKPKILCVDDESAVLDGLELHLRRRFAVSKATSGMAGLELLEAHGPFAVVISDMRMPGLDGAAFLAAVRHKAPDTVRLLLTGQSDVASAIAAVNQGQIFRFLEKPCPSETLLAAVTAALEQHRLVTAERVLLEETLRGSVRALTEVLALSNPLAFGRATRAKSHVAALAAALSVPERERWPIEVAAMLSQIGAVTLLPQTVEKIYYGRPLNASEEADARRLPAIAQQLLASIPRLEPVREILAAQELRFDATASTVTPAAVIPGAPKRPSVPVGARMLKIALDFDVLETQGAAARLALDTMRARRGSYDPEVLAAFADLVAPGGRAEVNAVQELGISALRTGLIFAEDVRTRDGALLIARGHEITPSLLERIRNYAKNIGVQEPLRVLAGGGGAKTVAMKT